MDQVAVRSADKELNDEDEILCGSAAARTLTRNVSYGSGANEQNHCTAADIRDGRARGGRSTLERCLHDRPRPKPVRRAHVDFWYPRRARAIQECVLTLTERGCSISYQGFGESVAISGAHN